VAATRTIEIRTEIPGPRSRELAVRASTSVAGPLQVYLPVFVEKALNATITDVDGNTFIDFAGGVGVVNVGHCHPQVVEAIQDQAARFIHTDFTVVPYGGYVELAERLGAVAPFAGPTRAAFFNSGAEAVENAVKIARVVTGRPAVIAFEAGFHGRTLLAMTMTSKAHPYKTGMGPYAPEVYRAPFPDAYRGPSAAGALAAIERMFSAHVPASRVAAIVFEPQLGEGGFIPAPAEFVEGLREICDREGILMVADEVQTGFGRTGRMFAMQHYGVEPDLMTVAKSIAAGLPLSGVVGKAEIMDAPHRGAIGGTYIGNPVALAAALAVLDVFAEEDLVARANAIGDVIRDRMQAWQGRWAAIGDVRGLGAMLAIELVRDPDSKEPAPDLAGAVIDAALERGLILLKAGLSGNCIRVLCPLTIEDAVLDEALGTWELALESVLG
jgi:4-aminobutyrate aminotransferase / (S)-3-amino-2-methylpropionate transaminase / 5-aminovalerate transaminase